MRHLIIISLLFSLSSKAQVTETPFGGKFIFLFVLSIMFFSCSTMPQIQAPPPVVNQNFASKGYVDTLIQKNATGNAQDINYLKAQIVQGNKTIDSLKNVIIINTVQVDTSSSSDFTIKNGVIIINKPNLKVIINAAILQHTVISNAKLKRRKIK